MTKLVYNGYSANPTIETCNSCNCQDDGWIDSRHQIVLDRPMMFTENEGRCHPWGKSVSIRTASDTAYSVAKWFTGGDGKYQGEFDDHDEGLGNLESTITFDLSSFKLNQQYLFEILSISLRINSDVTAYNLEYKARFDLDYLMQQDTNINPILLAAQSLNREHAFINGNDIGIYWLIEAVCRSQPG
ncbi:unnamed protein product [Adineta ricciae]|uniref:Uncharacterized protein n=1 Tax=Adineta ricciae TaxID=249248 RepID=A0A814XI80_ADIRI|nr:unnamed protein product [Adineta ricciae]